MAQRADRYVAPCEGPATVAPYRPHVVRVVSCGGNGVNEGVCGPLTNGDSVSIYLIMRQMGRGILD